MFLLHTIFRIRSYWTQVVHDKLLQFVRNNKNFTSVVEFNKYW